MSSYIKDLYEYELFKKLCRFGIISLKINFHRNKKSKDGLDPRCTLCMKKNYLDSRDRVK